MATIERERTIPLVGPARDASAQPVFTADGGRRERLLRVAGRVVAVLVAIWLVALLAGTIGFGRLPGLPGSSLLHRSDRPAEAPRARSTGGSAKGASFAGRPAGAVASDRMSRQEILTPSVRPQPLRPAVRPAAPPARTQVVAPLPPVSPGKPQGRAVRRRGNQTQPPPPPPGNANGLNGTSPGQLKHQLPPPPPPPPPLKKG